MQKFNSLIFSKVIISLFCLAVTGNCEEKSFAAGTPQADVDQRFWVRVLLLDNAQSCTLATYRPVIISDALTHAELARFDQLKKPTGITISPAGFVIAGKSIAAVRVTLTTETPHGFNLNGDDFRGELTLVANSSRTAFDAIDGLPLEPYLAGVIGAEMHDYWEPEALEAQAIAARTYCLYTKKRYGLTKDWDVTKTVSNQVYRGVKSESAHIWNIVKETSGQVLVADANEDLFPAYYCSSCGGHTENSRNVFGDSFGPLAGVPCPYCVSIAKTSRFFWPTAQFDKSDVSEKLLLKYPKLQPLGKIISIVPVAQTNYGSFSRLTMVRLIGATGKSDSIRAEDLRLTIDPTGRQIKSMICQIENVADKWAFTNGRGYGHGVGLCQCGVQGMARQEKPASEILAYYYPGSKIVKLY